jgi:hypothetical protein
MVHWLRKWFEGYEEYEEEAGCRVGPGGVSSTWLFTAQLKTNSPNGSERRSGQRHSPS